MLHSTTMIAKLYMKDNPLGIREKIFSENSEEMQVLPTANRVAPGKMAIFAAGDLWNKGG